MRLITGRDRFRRDSGLIAVGWGLWLLLAWLPHANAQVTMTAGLDRDLITLGESATLSVVFEGSGSPPAPTIPAIKGLNIRYVGPSQQFSFVNGRMTSSVTHSYQVTPLAAGEFVIPALSIAVEGKALTSQPIPIKVVAGAAGGGVPGTAAPRLAFSQLHLPKPALYLGEAVPVEIRLYFLDTRLGAAPQLQSAPELAAEGFTVGPLGRPTESRTAVSNRVYMVVTFKAAVSAARTGTLTLGPAICSAAVPVAPASRSRVNPGFPFDRDPFEDFFGPRVQMQNMQIFSEPLSVRILPLPATNAPPDFSGAVGRFQMAVEASPTNVAVGDPITVRVRLTGRGPLEALRLPDWKWPDFKLYPPTSRVEASDPLGLEGAKLFELVLVPQKADLAELPALTWSYFDPDQKAYRTLAGAPVPLVVRPGLSGGGPAPSSSAAQPGARPNASSEPPDIAPIRLHPGILGPASPPLLRQPWFLLLQLAPIALWLGLRIRRLRHDQWHRNPRLRRQRDVSRLVADGLLDLRRMAELNQAESFYAALFRLLQEQIGERLNLPASSITESVIEEHLRPRGVTEDACALLHDLFQKCNQARYAPAQIQEGLFFQVPKVETAFAVLRNLSLILLACLWFDGGAARAAGADESFDAANRSYAQGQFAEAIQGYEEIRRGGLASPALLFNLGNACLKADQVGKAIACYRLGLRIAPRDRDMRANLKLARARIGTAAVPGESRWQAWLGWFTLDEWTVAASVLFWSWLVVAAAGLWNPVRPARWRRATWTLAGATLALAIGLALAAHRHFRSVAAVVVIEDAPARYGPLEEARIHFHLRDGSEVRILDRQNDWLQARDAAGRIGWLKGSQLWLIE
ncbi:MAG TPA: BatD family protein [Candidatus Paceibacterota bacterium]|nr:BatD family protein [Candidatus Paceibacterota bacterium]